MHLSFLAYMPRTPAQPNITKLINPKLFGEEHKSWISTVKFPESPVTSFILGANIFLRTLFSKIIGLRSSLSISFSIITVILLLPYFNLLKKITSCHLSHLHPSSRSLSFRFYIENEVPEQCWTYERNGWQWCDAFSAETQRQCETNIHVFQWNKVIAEAIINCQWQLKFLFFF